MAAVTVLDSYEASFLPSDVLRSNTKHNIKAFKEIKVQENILIVHKVNFAFMISVPAPGCAAV